jgi:3-dehydroquinate synthetase
MNKGLFDTLHDMISINFPQYKWKNIDFEKYFYALSKDKKNVGESLVCILMIRPGSLIKKQIPIDENFKSLIRKYLLQLNER